MKIPNVVSLLSVAAVAAASPLPGAAQDCEHLSASGHVDFLGTAASNKDNHIQYSFIARSTGEALGGAGCVATGELEERVHLPDGTLFRHSHGTVVCMAVKPTATGWVAWIGARADRSTVTPPCFDDDETAQPETPPGQCLPEGIYGVIEVHDNGEGAGFGPDDGSAVNGRTEATIWSTCMAPPPLGTIRTAELLAGDVQIRP